MLKSEFIAWAKLKGWREDNYGHLQKQASDKQYRFKIGKNSIRYELKGTYGWIRIASGYLKDIKITADNKLAGLRRGI